jgi:hypothetical protein
VFACFGRLAPKIFLVFFIIGVCCMFMGVFIRLL